MYPPGITEYVPADPNHSCQVKYKLYMTNKKELFYVVHHDFYKIVFVLYFAFTIEIK